MCLRSGPCCSSGQRDGLSGFFTIGRVAIVVHRCRNRWARRSQIIGWQLFRLIGGGLDMRVLFLAEFLTGLLTSRNQIATRTTHRLCLDLSYGLLKRQPLAGYVRLAQRRLNATQLRKQGRARPIV
jgi:hypothetical protein